MDKNTFSKGGSSDPFITFNLRGSTDKPLKSSVKKKTIEPVFGDGGFDPATSGEHFVLPLELAAGDETLEVSVYDNDLVGAAGE